MAILITLCLNCAQKAIPYNADNWKIMDTKDQPQEIDLTTLYGKPCLHLPVGHIAYLIDSTYKDFRLEMDIAGIAMPGLGFRGTDKRNYEYLYLRVMSDNQEDALQYLPVFNGGFSWQLYNYPDYEHTFSYPKRYLYAVAGGDNDILIDGKPSEYLKEILLKGGITLSDQIFIGRSDSALWKILDGKNLTLHYLKMDPDSSRIYTGLEWIHLKLEVAGQKAVLFIDDMNTPAFIIDCLKHRGMPGFITFRNVFVESYYANFRIERLDAPVESEPCEDGDGPPPEYLSEWEISGRFQRNDRNIREQIDSVIANTTNWRRVKSESSGLINLSRYAEETEGSVLLKINVHSSADKHVDLLFDYAEHLIISLNSEIVFSESLRMNNNEGRVMDGEEKTDLMLKKGDNQLVFVVTADAYHQNWGVIAKLTDR